MVRATTTFLAILLLASVLASSPASCSSIDKARILTDIAATPSRASARVKTNREDASQLGLDLVVYRWACRSSGAQPDIRSIDQVINALVLNLNDPVLTWTISAFSTASESSAAVALPPNDDPRAGQLSELNRQLGMVMEFRESSPMQSVTALIAALDICDKLQLDLSGALVRTLLGNQYHYDMAKYFNAEECYSHAVPMLSTYDCEESAAKVYDDYGSLLTEMSRSLAATVNYTLAAQLWVQLTKQYPNISRYYEMAGREYIRAGQSQNAAGDSTKALQLLNLGLDKLRYAATMTKSYGDFIENLITVAQVYSNQGNLPRAQELLTSAENACKSSSDPLLEARVHEELNKVYKGMNLILKAHDELVKWDKVLEDAAQSGKSALSKLSSSENLTRETQKSLQLSAERGAGALEALKRYDDAAAMLQSVGDIYKRNSMAEEQIRCLRALAAIMDIQHKPRESLDARMEAAMLAMKSNKKAEAADIVQQMVDAFIEIGDLDNALDTLGELWSIMVQSGNVRGAADVLEGRGTLLASHGRYEDAIRNFQDALTGYSTQVGDPWAAVVVSLKLASAMEAINKPADAASVLGPILKDIETRYAQENVDPTKNSERSSLMLDMYRDLTSAYVRNDKKDEATALLATARRYQWIADLVAQLKASNDPTVSEFAKTVDVVGGASTSVPNVPNKQTLIANDWAEFSAKCNMLREQHPVSFNALPIKPLELYKSRNDLPRKALILEYLPTDYATYVFVCGNGKSSIWELGVTSKEIDALASSLRKVIRDGEQSMSAGVPLPKINDWREPTFLQFRDPMVALYSKLVAPIADELTSYQMLMFALPRQLNGIPMHALISSEKDGTPRFLVQDYEIGYLGEGMLGDLISKDSRPIDPSSDRLAIFADPAGNLPGASEEASMLKKLYYESFAYVGKRATVASFIRECDKASILHIATHYKVDPNPSKFVLQLAPDGDSDGEITIQELTSITNPHLQLVALSACDSAATADPLQSGTSCAAEVFSLAGAKSVLGGLWKVSDASATKLMGDFYRSLAKGNTRTESLRRAQVAMIDAKEYAHPFYWACFALYGNPW